MKQREPLRVRERKSRVWFEFGSQRVRGGRRGVGKRVGRWQLYLYRKHRNKGWVGRAKGKGNKETPKEAKILAQKKKRENTRFLRLSGWIL